MLQLLASNTRTRTRTHIGVVVQSVLLTVRGGGESGEVCVQARLQTDVGKLSSHNPPPSVYVHVRVCVCVCVCVMCINPTCVCSMFYATHMSVRLVGC